MLERHPGKPCNRKFDKEQIEEIKELRKQGKLYKDIAAQFNCSRRTIEKLCLGKTYQI
jgi:DNA invertase Pin-like site-specific DNA recombinase